MPNFPRFSRALPFRRSTAFCSIWGCRPINWPTGPEDSAFRPKARSICGLTCGKASRHRSWSRGSANKSLQRFSNALAKNPTAGASRARLSIGGCANRFARGVTSPRLSPAKAQCDIHAGQMVVERVIPQHASFRRCASPLMTSLAISKQRCRASCMPASNPAGSSSSSVSIPWKTVWSNWHFASQRYGNFFAPSR